MELKPTRRACFFYFLRRVPLAEAEKSRKTKRNTPIPTHWSRVWIMIQLVLISMYFCLNRVFASTKAYSTWARVMCIYTFFRLFFHSAWTHGVTFCVWATKLTNTRAHLAFVYTRTHTDTLFLIASRTDVCIPSMHMGIHKRSEGINKRFTKNSWNVHIWYPHQHHRNGDVSLWAHINNAQRLCLQFVVDNTNALVAFVSICWEAMQTR